MYARVSIARTLPEKMEQVIGVHREAVLPACQQQQGFRGLYLLQDPDTGHGMTITLWETEEEMAAGESSGYYQEQVARVADLLSVPLVHATYLVSVHP
ncbi:MAG: hypothetical protein FIB01_06655 [Gemmatimonadetes bacterium]|nr:hypothetical protein [Gemmatimonadota bacterium]